MECRQVDTFQTEYRQKSPKAPRREAVWFDSRTATDDDGLLKADALLTSSVVELNREEPRSIWVEMIIPEDVKVGTYNCKISLFSSQRGEDECLEGEMSATIEVLDYTAHDSKDNKFHLDLWQHLSNISRKHEAPLWSDAHFEIAENYVKTLGELGQKAVTLVVSEAPWGGQNCVGEMRIAANLFEYSIIPITKKSDGNFVYDFTAMQRYIDLCAKYNIDREISVYGICSNSNDIRYFDENDNSYKFIKDENEIDEYIKELEKYFINTNQINKVRLVADEPANIEAYRQKLNHILKIAPSFKFKAALHLAEFIGEFKDEVYDFAPISTSVANEYQKLKEYQKAMPGKRFLWYVCCGPSFPNTFLRSPLIDAYFIGIFTSYADFDGFLRWNYTVWNDNPRTDIRYGRWPAGDTNFVYPSTSGRPLLSLRYKALKRGIMIYELLECLKAVKDSETVNSAFSFILKEKDIEKYYKDAEKREAIYSLEYNDYVDMIKYIVENIK